MTHDHSEEIILLVGEMNGKLDILLEQHQDHGKRIVSLEKERTKLVGGIVGVTAAFMWFAHDKLPAIFALFH